MEFKGEILNAERHMQDGLKQSRIKERVLTMEFTRSELFDMASSVAIRLEGLADLLSNPEIPASSYCQVKYEDMSALFTKLTCALKSNAKCISIE